MRGVPTCTLHTLRIACFAALTYRVYVKATFLTLQLPRCKAPAHRACVGVRGEGEVRATQPRLLSLIHI